MTDDVFVGPRPSVRGYLPYLALVVGTLGLALSPMFVHWSGAPGPVAGFYRVSIAALVVALPVLGGVFYGLFVLTTQRAREGLSSTLTWWVAACFSSLSLLIITRLLHQPLTGYTSAGFISMIAAALVGQVAGYLAISYALGYLPASIVSPTLLGQPVLTALLAVPLLNESISWAQVAGGALVLAGIWFVNRPRTGKT